MRILTGPFCPQEGGGAHIYRALRDHDVVTFSEKSADIVYDYATATFGDILERLPSGWEPDLVLLWSPEYQGIPVGLEECPYPLVAAVGDWNLGFHAVRNIAGCFDYIFTDRKGVEAFRRAGFENVEHALLFGYDPTEHYRMPDVAPLYDIAIVGNLNHDVQAERSRWLARVAALSDRYRVGILSGLYGVEYTRTINQAKITFNHSIRGEMNMRAYEAPACGSLLFYEEDNLEVRDVYQDRVHCVLYNKDNLETLLEHYLIHEEERQKIVEAAAERVQDFTYARQMERMLERVVALGIITSQRPPRPFCARSAHDQHRARAGQALQAVTAGGTSVAVREMSAAEALDPSDSTTLNNLAVLYLSSHRATGSTTDRELALRYLDLAIHSGGCAVAHVNRAYALTIIGRQAEAVESIQAALETLGDCSHDQYASHLYIPRAYDTFRVEYEMAGAQFADDPLTYATTMRSLYTWRLQEWLGDILSKRQAWQAAVEAYRRAVDAKPDGKTRKSLAIALDAIGNHAEAVTELELAIADTPFLFDARQDLARILFRAQEWKACAQVCDEALRLIAACPTYESAAAGFRAWRDRSRASQAKDSATRSKNRRIEMTTLHPTPYTLHPTHRILTFNWHEPFISSLCKTGHRFDIAGPAVVGRTRIDGVISWDGTKRPLPSNATLLMDAGEVQRRIAAGAYDLAVCFTIFDLLFVASHNLPKIFCPLSSPKNELGAHYNDLAFRESFKEQFRTVTKDDLVVYMTEQMGREELGGYGLPGEIVCQGASVDPEDYNGYTGEIPAALRVGNHIAERWFLNYPIQQQVLEGLPHLVLGSNPLIPGSRPSHDWSDLLEQYRKHRVFFYSLHKEMLETPASTCLIEAMTTGMPIVCTEHPLSLVKDGYNGFVSDDIPTLRRRIEQLLEDHDLAHELGRNARATALEHFGIGEFVQNWNRAFAHCLEKNPRASRREITTGIAHTPVIQGLKEVNFLYGPSTLWEDADWRTVLNSYAECFTANDPVTLVINPHSVVPCTPQRLEAIAAEIENEVNIQGHTLAKMADIVLLDSDTAKTDVELFVRLCQALIAPGQEPTTEVTGLPIVRNAEGEDLNACWRQTYTKLSHRPETASASDSSAKAVVTSAPTTSKELRRTNSDFRGDKNGDTSHLFRVLIGPTLSSGLVASSTQAVQRYADTGRMDICTFSYVSGADVTLRTQDTLEDLFRRLPDGWRPDVLLCTEATHAPLLKGIENAPCPTMATLTDGWGFVEKMARIAPYYDAFVTSESYIAASLRKWGYRHVIEQTLHGYDPLLHRTIEGVERIYDVAYLGAPFTHANAPFYEHRFRYLARILERFGNHRRLLMRSSVPREEYVQLLNRSKINVNYSPSGIEHIVTARIYETLACGALAFIEEENQDARRLLEDRVHAVFYNENNLEDLLDYYLTHEEERRVIAQQGHDLAPQFSLDAQIAETLQAIEKLDLHTLLESRKERPTLPSARRSLDRGYAAVITFAHIDEAQAAFEETLAEEPGCVEAENNLGFVQIIKALDTADPSRQSQHFFKAIEYFNRAAHQHMEAILPLFNLAHLFLRDSQSTERAENAFRTCIDRLEGEQNVDWDFAGLFHTGSDAPPLEDSLMHDRSRFAAAWALDHLHERNADEESSRETLRKRILWQCWHKLGDILHRRADYPEALQAYRSALALFDDAPIRGKLAASLCASGSPEQAVDEYRIALAQEPFNEELRNAYIALLDRLDRTEEANALRTWMESLLSATKSDPISEPLPPLNADTSKTTLGVVTARPKVVFAAQYLYPLLGGAEHTANTILQELAHRGYPVEAICVGEPSRSKQGLVPVRTVPNPMEMQRAIVESRPDVVITQLNFAPAAIQTARELGVPTILSVMSYEHVCPVPMAMLTCDRECQRCPYWTPRSEFMRAQRWAVENADLIYCCSEHMARTMREFYDREVSVCYQPMDYGPNYAASSDPAARRFITMCTIGHFKGTQIFAEIAKRMPEQPFLIVGRGAPEAFGLDLHHNLTCWPETVPTDFYAVTRVMLAPALWAEPFGRTPLEAMANGIPVLASHTGGLPEAVGDAGILIRDFKNPDVWVEHLRNLLANEALYRFYAERGRDHSRRFGIEQIFPQFEAMLNRAVGGTSMQPGNTRVMEPLVA